MLRRKQVLMTHWLDDHIKFIAEKYDISYSEVIRLSTSFAMAQVSAEMFPECKKHLKTDTKSAAKAFKEFLEKGDLDSNHKIFSDWYFEARKVLELRQEIENKASTKKATKK